ncbi:MAG: hypothetical protein ACLPY5_05465 [Candidatus Bathyarchaeia archaeon]
MTWNAKKRWIIFQKWGIEPVPEVQTPVMPAMAAITTTTKNSDGSTTTTTARQK